MSSAHEFAASLVWTGASAGPTTTYSSYSREHEIEVSGKPKLVLSAAPEFRGDGSLHNPEDLLVAAVGACHLLSYLALCARRGVAVTSYRDSCVARMEVREGVLRFVEATLRPEVTISTDNVGLAIELHEEAHAECYIAASVNFPIDCMPVVRRAG